MKDDKRRKTRPPNGKDALGYDVVTGLLESFAPVAPPARLRSRTLAAVHRKSQCQPKPDQLVSCEWLRANLDSPRVRFIDCTVWMDPQPVGPSKVRGGREHYEAGHIPGAAYLHMVDDISDPNGRFPFALPPQADVEALLSSLGVTPDTAVVLYGAGVPRAVTRAWWVLRASGVKDVRILDGGWQAWREGGGPQASGTERFVPQTFKGERIDSMIANQSDVLSAIDDPSVCLINALTPEQFIGQGQHYGRPGRIPTSINLPARKLMDAQTGRYKSFEEICDLLESAHILEYQRIINYCGTGINATMNFFALSMYGFENVALYDGSLSEWSQNPDLPMETG